MADDQVVIGRIHDLLRDEGWCADAFEARDAAGAFPRAMHAAGVELDHPVGIGQTAVADARVLRIELDDVDAGNECVEDVAPLRHHGERFFDARLLTTVLISMTVR